MTESDLIRRKDVIKLVNQFVFGIRKEQIHESKKAFIKHIEKIPTAYDVSKVVEELEETMQDLSVIEVFSHIDFDSTIQSGLDNFLKAYNSELLRIVKQGGVDDDVCEWRLIKGYKFLHKTSCGNTFDMENNFKYCPFCGKKIKIVGDLYGMV